MRARALLLLLALCACAPITKTDYDMVQPKTKAGRQCASKCQIAQQNCHLACLMQNSECEKRAQLSAQGDYNSYVAQQMATNRSIARNITDFQRYYDFNCTMETCETACADTLHSCHTGCGGKVIPHSYCTAFCN